ncbi:alpha/beta hydrolase [Phycisphaerales bacterium AB-hyl4]|uniref:Alpha/beta hydrolase n=1 Tax=Natronomicrosphaera hydrolytica TaxID=3242702 RepID=A0ABV4UA83_9BACT
MSDFTHPPIGLHQGQPIRHTGVPLEQAAAAMVMLHGRGGTAESILELARMFDQPRFAYLAPQAAGNTWYPHSFLVPWQRNEPNVSSALQAVADVVAQIEAGGLPRKRIMLLGFSQGACLAAEFAARHAARYGGIAILTGGLIGEQIDPAAYHGSFNGTPTFLASGDPDPHVPWSRVEEAAETYRTLGADVTTRRYAGRPHTVSQDESEHVQGMMAALLEGDG